MSASFVSQQPRYNVELVTASNPEGEDFYAYLLLPEAGVEVFRAALKTSPETIELEKYGVVLASGKGHVPSQEHVDYITKRFGS